MPSITSFTPSRTQGTIVVMNDSHLEDNGVSFNGQRNGFTIVTPTQLGNRTSEYNGQSDVTTNGTATSNGNVTEPNPRYPTPLTQPNTSSIPITASLSSSGSDPDNDPLTFEVRFGATNPPPQVVATRARPPMTHPVIVEQYHVVWRSSPTTAASAWITRPNLVIHQSTGRPHLPRHTSTSARLTNGTINGIAYTGSDILKYTKIHRHLGDVLRRLRHRRHQERQRLRLPARQRQHSAILRRQPGARPALGTFAAHDVARFDPTRPALNTAGTFAWYFDASDVGLTTARREDRRAGCPQRWSTVDQYDRRGLCTRPREAAGRGRAGPHADGHRPDDERPWAVYFNGTGCHRPGGGGRERLLGGCSRGTATAT